MTKEIIERYAKQFHVPLLEKTYFDTDIQYEKYLHNVKIQIELLCSIELEKLKYAKDICKEFNKYNVSDFETDEELFEYTLHAKGNLKTISIL